MKQKTLTGILLDERIELSLDELGNACSCSVEQVIALVEEGVVEPISREQPTWHFSGASLKRARAAVRLQRDLSINLAGVALALDLMEEVETLRERLRRIETDDGT